MTDLVVKLLMKTQNFDNNIAKSTAQLQKFKAQADIANKGVGNFADSLTGTKISKFMGVAGAITGAAAVIGSQIMRTVKNAREFETALAELSALTGMTGEKLDELSDRAFATGSALSKSASEIATAYKIMGSQMPQLLENGAALDFVTSKAIILSKAAKMDLTESSKALATAMNQMGAPIEQAAMFIDIYATASQKGSADIAYLSKAIEKSGGAASATGISFLELASAIETVAPKIATAEEAGTQLKGVFLALEQQTDDNLKPSVVGFSTALQNLSLRAEDSTYMIKTFGVGNYNAALALATGADKCQEFISVLNDAGMAANQASIQGDTLDAKINKLTTDWDNFLTSLGNTSFIKTVVEELDTAVNDLSNSVELLSGNLNKVRTTQAGTQTISIAMDKVNELVNGGMSRDDAYDAVKKMIENGEIKIDVPKTNTPWYRRLVRATNPIGMLLNGFSDFGDLVTNDDEVTRNAKKSTIDALEANRKNEKEGPVQQTTQAVEKSKKSIKDLEGELNALKKERDESTDPARIKLLNKEIDTLSDRIKKLRGTGGSGKNSVINHDVIKGDADSVEALEYTIHQLEQEMNRTSDADLISLYGAQVQELKQRLTELKDKIKEAKGEELEIKIETGSIVDLENKIADLEDRIKKSSDETFITQATQQVKELKSQVNETEIKISELKGIIVERPEMESYDDTFDYDKYESEIYESKASAAEKYYNAMLSYNEKVSNANKYTDAQLKEQYNLWQQLSEKAKNARLGEDLSDSVGGLKNLQINAMTELPSVLGNVGNTWRSLNDVMKNGDGFEIAQGLINTFVSTFQTVQTVIAIFDELTAAKQRTKVISEAMNASEIAGITAKTAAETTAAGATVANTATVVSAKQTENAANINTAVTGAASSVAGIPLVGWIMAGIAAASIIALLAAHKFEHGGIVGGNSYSGDKIFARLNSGEMVLNRRQQGNLFNMLNNGNEDGVNNSVEFKVKGKDLVGVLSNYNSLNKKRL